MSSQKTKLQEFLESASLEWQKMKPGLDRILTACHQLGNPEKKIKFIHVAGTNGKGSVAAMLQSVLSDSGLKVGLFTSPHLIKVNERFRIGNEEISDEELESLLDFIQEQIPPGPPLSKGGGGDFSFFELCTLVAFLYFADQKVDIAILETGLGGRLDATNVVTPLISVITEIGLDHTEILGPDIASIAREKAGIIKEGVPVVCGASDPEAIRVIEEVASSVGANLVFAQGDHKDRPYNFPYKLNLSGLHQIHNAEIVLKVIEVLNQNPPWPPFVKGGWGGFETIHEETIRLGLQNVRWPGRLEWISKNPPILLDGAHNVEGMRALVEYLKSPQPPFDKGGRRGDLIKWKTLFSAASDKNVEKMLELLQEVSSEIILCKMKNSRSIDPGKMVGADLCVGPSDKGENPATPLRTGAGSPLRISNDPIQSFHEIKKSLREGEGILITGSLYFIGEMKALLDELNPTNE